MIESLEPFIEAGYYTVPLNSSTISRVKVEETRYRNKLTKDKASKEQYELDSEGIEEYQHITYKKKFKAPENWQQYTKTFNEIEASVGAIITGKLPNTEHDDNEHAEVVAIDCDSPEAYQLVSSLVPGYQAVIRSKDKRYPAKHPTQPNQLMSPQPGTFLFKRHQDDPATINNLSIGDIHLEVFNGGNARMVFLPTANNKTKEPWATLPELMEMPQALRALLTTLVQPSPTTSQQPQSLSSSTDYNNAMKLNPLISRFIGKDGQYDSQLFKVITPKQYRNEQYNKEGHRHPKTIEDRSDYLFKISTMLGTDSSIDKDMYLKAMAYINDLLPVPLDQARLKAEITMPMSSGKACHDGKVLWAYDKHWEMQSLTLVNKNGENIEYFYETEAQIYYEINHTSGHIGTLLNLSNVKNHLLVTMPIPLSKGELEQRIQTYRQVLLPHKPFGPVEGKPEYNTFKATEALMVLNNPKQYIESSPYTKPEAFIQYMETLIPDEADRKYLIRHLRTKLTTFAYSSVIYYIVGTHGSGKSLFSKIITSLVGDNYVSQNVSGAQLMEATGFNGWLLNKYFVHFDELHREIGKRDAAKATERLKNYSGSTTFQARVMRTDTYQAPMTATFLLTQNGENMDIPPEDRRFFYVNTPNKLPVELAEAVLEEINTNLAGIAYYMATEYTNLSPAEYVNAPSNPGKLKAIENNMPLSTRLIYLIQQKDYATLYEKAEQANQTDKLLEWHDKGRIKVDALVNIYETLSGHEINKTVFLDLIKSMLKQPSSQRSGANEHYCVADGWSEFIPVSEIIEDIDIDI